MLSFWDRAWLIHAAAVRDYFKEREEQKKKWVDFCQKCTEELLAECRNIANLVDEAAGKQSGIHVHKDLVDGIVQLPLYGFYLVLSRQDGIAKEQSHILRLFFSHFRIPYSMNLFLSATKSDNYVRQDLLKLVGISEIMAGGFWVQFFKVLYRTDEDTTYISKLINSFCSVAMRFAALSGKTESYLLEILEKFLRDVHLQAELCRQIPEDDVDFYGDASFVEHFNRFKEDAYRVCRMTMDENDDTLNPTEFFKAFTLGIIYQVVRRCTRNRTDKIRIIDDVLAQVDIDGKVDGDYIFKYMEDFHGEETSMLAYMMHLFTDLEDRKPMGWIMLTRASGTYNLETKKNIRAVQEAMNFIIGMENYLTDKYPMSGFGQIASEYSKEVAEIINQDIDENVEIVDESTYTSTRPSSTKSSPVGEPAFSGSMKGGSSTSSSYSTSSTASGRGMTGSSVNTVKSGKKFFHCPACGKLIVYRTTKLKQYCPDCYEGYDESTVSERDYIYSRSEMKYYDIVRLNKKQYLKICFVTGSGGFIFKPFEDKDGYHEDYFCTRFKVQGGRIVEEDDILNDQYMKNGDFLYDPRTVYNGTIPGGDYFDGFYSFNDVVKPIRFKRNGTVVMLSENSPSGPVEDEGHYLREGNLIRTDLTNRKGEFSKSLWLIVNGKLSRDAYVNDAGFDAAKELLNREMPEKKRSFLGRLFGK